MDRTVWDWVNQVKKGKTYVAEVGSAKVQNGFTEQPKYHRDPISRGGKTHEKLV